MQYLSLLQLIWSQITTTCLVNLFHTSVTSIKPRLCNATNNITKANNKSRPPTSTSIPSYTVEQFLVVWIVLQPLLVCFQSFIIFLHEELNSTFSCVTLRESWIKLNAFLSVLQTLGQGPKFCVACCSITICLDTDKQASAMLQLTYKEQ